MGYNVSKLVVEPFTNEIGQTINPGDKVVAVITGYNHNVRIITGVFEGVRRHVDMNDIMGTNLKDVPVYSIKREYTEDGEHEETNYDWEARKRVPTGRRYNLLKITEMRKSRLQRNRVFKLDTPATELGKVRL